MVTSPLIGCGMYTPEIAVSIICERVFRYAKHPIPMWRFNSGNSERLPVERGLERRATLAIGYIYFMVMEIVLGALPTSNAVFL